MKIDFNSGGAKVIDNIMSAYGFKTKLQLCHHLGLSSANLSMRYKRDFFPADLVVRCMADTGVSLASLVNGSVVTQGIKTTNCTNYSTVKVMELLQGKLQPLSEMVLDNSLLPEYDCEAIKSSEGIYLIRRDFEEVFSGKYLVEIEGRVGIYDLQRYPVNMVRITGGSLSEPIECKLDEIVVLAQVITAIYDLAKTS